MIFITYKQAHETEKKYSVVSIVKECTHCICGFMF